MIEKIARRAGGFASTTAMRWLGAAGDHIPDVELPTPSPSGRGERLRAPLTKGGAVAGTIVFLSSTKIVRTGVSKGLQKFAEAVRPDGPSTTRKRRTSPTTSTKGSATRASSNGSTNGSSNGASNGTLSKKTRAELYELAKSKNISGRSSMSKEELARALSQS